MKLLGKIFLRTFQIIFGTILGFALVGGAILLAPYIAAAAAFIGSIGVIGWAIILLFFTSNCKEDEEKLDNINESR